MTNTTTTTTGKAVKVQTTAISKLSAQITVNGGTSAAKTVTISEGDIVHGLTYTDKGVPYTIDGIVTIINYSSAANTSNETACLCKRGSKFAQNVRITNLVVDHSTEYEAKVDQIPLSAIVNIDSVNVSALGIKNIEVVDYNKLKFTSDSVIPDSVIWNNDTVEFEQDEAGDFVATVETMLEKNVLRIFSEDRFFSTTVDGITPYLDRPECIKNSIIAASMAIMSTSEDVSRYMVPVAASVGATESVKIGDDTYTAEDVVTIETTDGALEIPAFVIEEGLLKIAVVTLLDHADPTTGNVDVAVNDFTFSTPGMTDLAVETTVNASVGGGKGGSYRNEATSSPMTIDGIPGVMVVHERQDGSAYISVSATIDKNEITNNLTALRFDPDGVVQAGTFGSLRNLYNSQASGAFTSEADLDSKEMTYKFFVFDYGVFAVKIDTTESICKFKAADEIELKDLLANSDAMYIELSDNVTADAGVCVNRNGVVLDGRGHKLIASNVPNTQAGVLVMADNVTVKNISVEATGEYAVKASGKDNVTFSDVTAVSYSKGAIQVGGSEVELTGVITVEAPWGGIEVCTTSAGAIPSLTVSATQIINRNPSVPAVWIDKVAADNLENAVIDTAGILTRMPLSSDKANADQIWFK